MLTNATVSWDLKNSSDSLSALQRTGSDERFQCEQTKITDDETESDGEPARKAKRPGSEDGGGEGEHGSDGKGTCNQCGYSNL